MIKCIVFDFGGVITLSKNGMRPTQLAFCDAASNLGIGYKNLMKFVAKIENDLMTGRMTENEFYSRISTKFSLAVTPAQLKYTIEKFYRKHNALNPSIVKMIKTLGKNYSVNLVTDVYPMHYRERKDLGQYELFKSVVTSLEVKEAKVDGKKKIWLAILKKMKAKPYECVVIDDKKKNLIVPRRMGMKIIHFRSAKQLKRDLKILGIRI